MKTPNTPEKKKYDEKIINEIKEDYLKGESKAHLYKEYGQKYNIDKFSFMNILKEVHRDLGFKTKTKESDNDWNVDSKQQMNLDSKYDNSTYIKK